LITIRNYINIQLSSILKYDTFPFQNISTISLDKTVIADIRKGFLI